ncbi:MAG: dTDP-4-dehydrorhamnose 3,5-epimerase family protein [Candidatus Pacearchaeota archaeon]
MEFITLKNKDKEKLIKDILLFPLKINQDESGILVETLRKDWKDIYDKDREFSMQYFSVTDSGIARDEKVWHIHPNYQEDRFLLAQGEIVTAVADQREGSPTKGLLNLFYMKAYEDPYIVLIPRNTLHGFMVVSKEPAILLNYPTGLYNPQEEGRIPYEEAKVKMADGTLFSWGKVREHFGINNSKV